ncbi:MAG: hypothetical protein GC145_19355 [Caulobacter sp.]|nr:hypothetical protein [Caulobacter sp.]
MIKTTLLGLSLALMAAGAPSAQTPPARAPAAAPAPPLGPPRAFPGYTQPDITPGACRVISQTQTMCTIPGMTAGRYVAHATGTSTAQGEGAGQALVIQVGSRVCGRADRRPTAQAPWTSGAKTLMVDCEFVVLTDRPLQVIVTYGDAKATRDPRGPTLKIERAPWDGVLSTQISVPEQP